MSLRREQVAALEARIERVRAFLLELTGGRPLEDLRREADACMDSADLDIAWSARVAADAGELLAELDGSQDVPAADDGGI